MRLGLVVGVAVVRERLLTQIMDMANTAITATTAKITINAFFFIFFPQQFGGSVHECPGILLSGLII
jgi:hypothetical protein